MTRTIDLIGSTNAMVQDIASVIGRGADHLHNAARLIERTTARDYDILSTLHDPAAFAEHAVQAHSDLYVGAQLTRQLAQHPGVAAAIGGATSVRGQLDRATQEADAALAIARTIADAATDLAENHVGPWHVKVNAGRASKDGVKPWSPSHSSSGAAEAAPNRVELKKAVFGDPDEVQYSVHPGKWNLVRLGDARRYEARPIHAPTPADVAIDHATAAASALRYFGDGFAETLTSREISRTAEHSALALADARSTAAREGDRLADLLDASTGMSHQPLPAATERPAIEA